MMQLISAKQAKPKRSLHLCEDCSVVLGNLNEAFMWINKSGHIDFANAAVSKLSQYSSNELKGMSISELTDDVSSSLWDKYWESISVSGQIDIECNLVSKDGHLTPVSINLQTGKQNVSVPMASAIIKVSPRSLDEHTRLKRVSYEYDRLLYRTSHDLKAPISTVLGLINLLKHDKDANQQQYLDLIEETIGRQQQLMQDINHLALIGSTDITMEKINFPMLVDDVLTSFVDERKKRKIEWRFNFKLNAPFYSDVYLLTKILIPIVDNAIRYNNNQDPSIKLSVESTSEKAVIIVQDNGMGVMPGLSKSIFEMFFRGAETSTGSGLGLYLALITANKLRGNVVFLPTEERGATFKIEIPNISYSEFTRSPF